MKIGLRFLAQGLGDANDQVPPPIYVLVLNCEHYNIKAEGVNEKAAGLPGSSSQVTACGRPIVQEVETRRGLRRESGSP